MDYYEIKKDLRAEIMGDMPPERQYSDDEIMQIIDSRIQTKSQEICEYCYPADIKAGAV